MQSQDFDVIASHAIDGDVVLMQDQFTGASTTSCCVQVTPWCMTISMAYRLLMRVLGLRIDEAHQV